jgi:hypothetical protein
MSTWNSIEIHNPGTLTVDTLPDALGEDGEMWESYDVTDNREDTPPYIIQGRVIRDTIPGDPDGSLVITGRSKYMADRVKAELPGLAVEGRCIVHDEEWDDDEVGQAQTVYEDGEEKPEQAKHSELVPDSLGMLVTLFRDDLARFDAATDDNTERAAAIQAIKSARALVDALRPEAAR